MSIVVPELSYTHNSCQELFFCSFKSVFLLTLSKQVSDAIQSFCLSIQFIKSSKITTSIRTKFHIIKKLLIFNYTHAYLNTAPKYLINFFFIIHKVEIKKKIQKNQCCSKQKMYQMWRKCTTIEVSVC